MVKCDSCGKFLSQIEGVKCMGCALVYHRSCLGINSKTNIPQTWKCSDCRKKHPKTTPVKGARPNVLSVNLPGNESDEDRNISFQSTCSVEDGQLDLAREIRLCRDEMRTIRSELRDFRQEMQSVASSISLFEQRMDVLENRVSTLEDDLNIVKNQRNVESISKLENTIAILQSDLRSRDQDLLLNDIEISNIPEQNNENVYHTVALVAAKISIKYDEQDIIHAYRVGLRNRDVTEGTPQRPRPIVVRLARKKIRDEFLKNARIRRGLTTENMDLVGETKKFYINERLTKYNKQLFFNARQTCMRLRWKYSWTREGKIFVRQESNKPAFIIREESDIMSVFGSHEVSSNK
ncbi:unnamed protein product [Colias eurytheme]|nr:unnamed protein product [Colias eurytheme]